MWRASHSGPRCSSALPPRRDDRPSGIPAPPVSARTKAASGRCSRRHVALPAPQPQPRSATSPGPLPQRTATLPYASRLRRSPVSWPPPARPPSTLAAHRVSTRHARPPPPPPRPDANHPGTFSRPASSRVDGACSRATAERMIFCARRWDRPTLQKIAFRDAVVDLPAALPFHRALPLPFSARRAPVCSRAYSGSTVRHRQAPSRGIPQARAPPRLIPLVTRSCPRGYLRARCAAPPARGRSAAPSAPLPGPLPPPPAPRLRSSSHHPASPSPGHRAADSRGHDHRLALPPFARPPHAFFPAPPGTRMHRTRTCYPRLADLTNSNPPGGHSAPRPSGLSVAPPPPPRSRAPACPPTTARARQVHTLRAAASTAPPPPPPPSPGAHATLRRDQRATALRLMRTRPLMPAPVRPSPRAPRPPPHPTPALAALLARLMRRARNRPRAHGLRRFVLPPRPPPRGRSAPLPAGGTRGHRSTGRHAP
jgi:hypothetical protein